MRIDFKKSFTRDLKKLKDKNSLQQIREVIEQVEEALNPQMINNLKELKGEGKYFRIKLEIIGLG